MAGSLIVLRGPSLALTDFTAADDIWKEFGFSSRNAFGREFWGAGTDAKRGTEYFKQTMTRETLQGHRFTREHAITWRDAYAAEYAANPKNATAGARRDLMDHYANLLAD